MMYFKKTFFPIRKRACAFLLCLCMLLGFLPVFTPTAQAAASNYYLDRLIRNMWNGEIKVITGIRRCGKSVLLFELFDEYLRNHGTDATQIIKIELDQRRYYKYRNPITCYNKAERA